MGKLSTLGTAFVVASIWSSTSFAATFEKVVDTNMVMRQFLTDGLGYGLSGGAGAVGRFETDAVTEVPLSDAREAGSALNFVSRDDGIVFSINAFSSNQRLNVFETNDGGQTWASLGEFTGFAAPTVRWYSESGAYVIAAAQDDQNQLVVFQTTDRFQTAAEVTWASPNGGGSKLDFAGRVIPVSADVMFAPDGGGMLYTDDGAQTWTSLESLTGLGSNDVLVGTANVIVRQYNSNTQFSTWVSTDGGQNWAESTLPEESTSIASMDFLNDQLGLAVVRIGANQNQFGVVRTADGGLTWTADTLPAEMQGSPVAPHYVTEDVQYVSTERELLRVGTPTGNSATNNSTNNGTTGDTTGSTGGSTNSGTNSGSGATNGSGATADDDKGCATAGSPGTSAFWIVVAGLFLGRRRRRG